MRLPTRRITDDRDLEQETGIKRADHQHSHLTLNSEAVRRLERKILGPSWGRKRRPFRPR